jgi:nucleotide-binding universal stress UspA family protein
MKKILVAVDTSTVATAVLERAALLAKAFEASVLLVRAVGLPTELPPEALSMDPDSVTGLLVKAAERDLERASAVFPRETKIELSVQVGTPWRIICDLAEDHDVELIVLGAHGHRLLDRVLGTTTNRVVSHTERSMHIVRPVREGTSVKA